MSEEQKRLLERQLWAVADTLRSSMNADEYKNYILGFIFYKYLSEKQEVYAENLLKNDKVDFADLDEKKKQDQEYIEAVKNASLEKLGFFLRPSQLFSQLVKKGKGEIGDDKFILEELKAVLNSIEQTSAGTDSEDDFKGLFDDVDLTSVRLGQSEKAKNETITEILVHLSKIDFKLEDSKSDVLGDAYEYLISQFAAGAGKKAGEFYTPSQVSRLMAMIVTEDKKKLRSVYDPTCGSGSLLLRLGDYAQVVDYYGQEYNTTTYNLARMNMILHGVHFSHFRIENGNTLTEDKLPDLKAEAVVANPPFGSNWKGDTDPTLATDERFSQYGRLAPKSAADYAFVTHMLHHLADNGTMTVVLPHGALFRGGAEGHIRKYIIEKLNYLDAVIGLPSNLFYGTSIPATVLVFKKCRKDDDSILFIEASREFRKGKNQNHIDDENIEKIFDTYKSRKEIEKYSHNATLDEIKENDFNLNIPRYVDTFEEEEPININAVAKELKELNLKEMALRSKIAEFCDELKIDNPF
ncbi:MAG: type I restriction-modification system subunit M [Parcubacteria group bacterium CG11_big_fil_rev_8_21_14_0_20_39_22]|nr:MAG: type I restriction-modification system subunit M [Parcubacteria group bacterium CG11_big_fil_rev_8_21_14_0_20_39_22]